MVSSTRWPAAAWRSTSIPVLPAGTICDSCRVFSTACLGRNWRSRVAERAGAGRAWRPSLPVWGGALAAAAVLIVTLVVERPQTLPPAGSASMQVAELEILQRLELLQDFELLQDLELLAELEGRG
jgi:hypothetical protein